MKMTAFPVLGTLLLFTQLPSGAALAALALPSDTTQALEILRKKHALPALAVVVVKDGTIWDRAATGVRKFGDPARVTTNDLFHIGSCTKSMTATLAARLIEEGKLRWDTTIAEVFPELKGKMSQPYASVTLEQLLVHRAGAPRDPPADLWAAAKKREGTPTEQRSAFVKGLLAHRPDRTPGTHWEYSDAGYAIVGAMMERVTGKAWEDLMRERLFVPLGLKSAGFGEPATVGQVDQPWGHRGDEHPFHPVPPGPLADNPPAIGPAATVHCSIADFARYAAWHVAGARGDGWLLKPESFTKLHTPPAEQEYAMGWAVTKRRWAGGITLMHNGENEMFYAVMWLGPGENTCFVAACNCDGPEADAACDEAIKMMINRF